MASSAPLGAHLDYLRRDGVTRDGEKARLFGPGTEDADGRAFAERCGDDRHHFRFIVSPDDALDMSDLRSFTDDLVGQMEKDLGTRLDWVAVDHWNTAHPHVHLIVRGTRDDGQDLVISRDYIKEGMRDRARDLITLDLGPRTDLDIRRSLEAQIEAERWTQLDRQLARDAGKSGIVDLAPLADHPQDEFHTLKVGRLRTLEILGLADQIGQSQWFIKPEAEAVLRELGERSDIIKRMHRALTERGIERGSASYVLAGESLDVPVIGRLVERGLDDELKGTAYAVVDGADGRSHHIRLPHLDAAGDSPPGSIVELRAYEDAQGARRVALAVRSDLDLGAQIGASGATWLDRQAIAREPIALSDSGFGAEVRQALDERAEHLIGEGYAERQGGRVVFARRLLSTLRRRELDSLAEKLAADTGMSFERAASGEYVAGSYRQRFALASGRFAMIEGPGPDGGLGFQLVPWSPSLEKQIGRHVSGVARDDGGIDWDFGRKRSLGL
jgi:type IV secretory pathway VirD2 relaxase